MINLWTIARREVISQFVSPVGYLVWLVFAVLVGGWFLAGFQEGQAATMRPLLGTLVGLLVFIAPAISMRLVSEELKTNTIELLMTAPVSDSQVILGKWLGAVLFFLVLLTPIGVVLGVMEYAADPDYGPVITGLLGLFFVGALYLSIGVCVSTATDSQVTAYLVTALITGMMTYGLATLMAADSLPGWIKPALSYMNVNQQYADFAKGLIDLRQFVYFISLIALFLFIGTKLLESKRWR